MRVIGLTGGIAAGKSAVKSILEDKGLLVIDTDELAHKELLRGSASFNAVIELLGTGILDEDKNINRKKIAGTVFADDIMRKELEKILHPQIRAMVLKGIKKAESEGLKKIFVDVPLLFEAGWQDLMDEVWVVYIPRELQIVRLMSRDGFDREKAVMRIDKQMSLPDKCKRANLIIDNTGSVDALKEQVLLLISG